jgi:hypothetical protein
MVLAVIVVMAGVGVLGTAVYGQLSGKPLPIPGTPKVSSSPTPPPPPPPPTLQAGDVAITSPATTFFSYAFYDRRTNEMTGSDNSATKTNTTESMIKVWLASDYLRRLGTKQPSKTALNYISTAIRISKDASASWLYRQDGGKSTITRLISMCGLKNTKYSGSGWAYTTMTAQDAVRMGLCVADGRAAGPQWTEYILEEMRHVQGTAAAKDQEETTGGGHWGIIDGLPKNLVPETSIKNGWTNIQKDANWHVNCLAIHTDWILVVQVRLKSNTSLRQKDEKGLKNAASVCAQVAKQLTVVPTAAG